MTEYILTVSPDTFLWIRSQLASIDADEMTGYHCVGWLVGSDKVPPIGSEVKINVDWDRPGMSPVLKAISSQNSNPE